jgi:hypothetical protein
MKLLWQYCIENIEKQAKNHVSSQKMTAEELLKYAHLEWPVE